MKKAWFAGVLLLWPLTATAAEWLEVDADFALTKGEETVRVGEPFQFVITARHAPGGIALLPSPLDLGAEVVERESARKHSRTTEGDTQIDRYELQLLAFDKGLITIPAVPLALGTVTSSTPAMEIAIASGFEGEDLATVSSTQAEAMEILENLAAQNPPPQQVMVPDYTFFWVVGGLLLLAIALLVARAIARRERAPTPVPPPPPPRPAHELALERLQALRQADHLASGGHKIFYTELSAIMRAYAGGRWQFDSLDLTVDELLVILEGRRTDGLEVNKMQHLLQLADQVKFAKFVPTKADGDQLLADAEDVVDKTKARPAPLEVSS